ncbi:hypothetical protein GTP46_09900 [Duganella sp. FT135W]|uniref:Uncharacterized protein n=1 Tax=Duganella flavida TaxID=2692175 RepID=A0A6L8K6G6_9BURK|nr:hypothetical protein [Duganella flavida]MYM22956.1 hypothetical protein [Duganella flavida]
MNLTKAKAYCRKLPGATEDIKWESNLVFSIGDVEVAQLLKRSYELVFAKLTKKLQREIQGT